MSEIPSYINKDFFEKSLRETFNANLNIDSIEIKKETSGRNYCSHIYRVIILYRIAEGDIHILHLLVKDLFESMSAISTEYMMYKMILSELNKILQCSFGSSEALTPKVYASEKSTRELHVFEDLNAQDYEICDRFIGFNEAETRMVLHKLAQFHATSMVFRQKFPDVVAKMNDTIIKSNSDILNLIENAVTTNVEYITKIAKNWPNFKNIVQKVQHNVGKTFRKKLVDILNKEDARVRVIVHGDLWIKNILIKKTINDVDDVIFLDFQNSCDGSPAWDIHNIFMTSVQLSVLKKKRLRLIKHYYQSLLNTLTTCGYPATMIPTLNDILYEIQRTEYYTFYVLNSNFLLTNMSDELAQSMNVSNFFDAQCMTKVRKYIFSNRRVLDTYAYELRRLDELGVLD